MEGHVTEGYVINIREIDPQDRGIDYVYIGRPSKWGNPYSHIGRLSHVQTCASREDAIFKYEEWIRQQPHLMADLDELRGKVLGCYCAPLPCHGDVLLRLLKETS